MARELVVKIGLGGQISDTIKWDAKDSAGLSIARMVIDDLVSYAKMKSEEHDVSYDISIDDGEHELLLVGKAHEERFVVYFDGEEVIDWQTRMCGRFDLIASFIGYNI